VGCKTLTSITVITFLPFITFRESRRRREMYCGHARLCVCLCVCVSVCLSAATCLHYCTDPDVTRRSSRACPLVVHHWSDFQSVHGLRCYGNITRTQNVSEYMLILAQCLVIISTYFYSARNARIASAVLAIAIPSVCLSVCLSVRHMPVLCQNDGT